MKFCAEVSRFGVHIWLCDDSINTSTEFLKDVARTEVEHCNVTDLEQAAAVLQEWSKTWYLDNAWKGAMTSDWSIYISETM